jgi:hypothetical protein
MLVIRILLLDCSEVLEARLKDQGFNVETGTVGYCTGMRKLPSQVYEKDIIVYNPARMTAGDGGLFTEASIKNETPQFDLNYLESRIKTGATLLAFLNPVWSHLEGVRRSYEWLPFMPPIGVTCDKLIYANRFGDYPASELSFLSPVVETAAIDIPVRLRVHPPEPIPYQHDVLSLFWNAHGQSLGVLLKRGRGKFLLLPKFRSNDDLIETFFHRVMPKLHGSEARTTLFERFISPAETTAEARLKEIELEQQNLRDRNSSARAQVAAARRTKINLLAADDTAKQVLVYFDNAKRQEDAALFYLYKIVEAIENKLGGEAEGIKTLGAREQWKSVKKLANESYRDARHAPKPTDVIKKWTQPEIRQCFADTEAVVMAYFASLFKAPGISSSADQNTQ